MDPFCKNNLKNFLRRRFLPLIVLLFTAWSLLKDEIAAAAVFQPNYFNKIFTDTVPRPHAVKFPSRDSLAKDTSRPRPVPARDTVPPPVPDSLRLDTASVVKTDTVNVRLSKDSLTAPVNYKAEDSIVMYVKKKEFRLYKKADVKYENTTLTGNTMDFNQATGILTSRMGVDTAGKPIDKAVLNDGATSSEMDSVQYNFNSGKAMIYQTRAQYGEGFVASEKVKKQPDNTIFGFRNGYTTCNLDTPHFSFRAKKIKVIPNKLIVSGPANLEIEGIPTPLFIPFAIFPISQGQRTGLLPPQYVVNQQKGLGLENGGYYFGLGEYLDMTVRANIYSYGSWGATFSPSYRKRYKYNGGLNLAYSLTRFGDPEVKEDFSRSKDFHITWSHSQDGKARPGTNFGASVQFGTSSYNTYNVFDASRRLNNNMSSSINYSKSWVGKPYNLTLAANHNQNNSTRQYNINFPDGSFNVNTIYPFQRQEMVGNPKWYEKIGVSYNALLRNNINFADSTFGTPAMFDRLQAGMQHQIPISLSIPLTRNIIMTPNVNYTEKWYIRQQHLEWNPTDKNLDTTYVNGFFRSSAMSAGTSLSTALYGMYGFRNKKSKVQAIRHVMRPNIGVNYSPDLASGKEYDSLQTDMTGIKTPYSFFAGAPFGPSSNQTFAGLTFGIDNNLEMKVRSDKDTSGFRKVKILDGFGISSSYNLVADSFNLSPFVINARTNLFDKVNISASGTIDPYQLNEIGRRVNKYMWKGDKFSLGRLTNANIALSTSFQSQDAKTKEKQKQKEEMEENGELPDAQLEEQRRQLEMMRANPGDYVDFDIPWRLDLSYSLNYTRGRSQDLLRDTTIFTQYLGFSGDFSLTPKWKIIMSSGFDFRLKQISYTTLTISRDLHCWQMSINLVPFGSYRQFSITINPKAGILRDLRINRTRQFQDF